MKKHMLCLFLCAALCTLLFAACTQETGGEKQEAEDGVITAEMLSGYQITRSDFSSREETAAAVSLRRALAEVLGKEPVIDTDWDEGGAIPEKEILIGKTNRSETAAFAERFRASGADCAYGVIDGKVILYAENADDLQNIVDKFAADVLGGAPCTVTEDHAPALTEGCFAGYTCIDRLVLEDGSDVHSSLRTDILWGVNGHNELVPPYGESNMEDILRLAAEMGSGIFRINWNPTTSEHVSYISDIIDRCHAYGMKVMMCLDDFTGTPEEITERMTYIAEHMKDKVDYFQIFNETDIWAAQKDDGSFVNMTDFTGSSTNLYNPERIPAAVEKMRAALDAFHTSAPDAKLVVNVGYRHFPMIDWYMEAGLSWDIIGFDFYDLSSFKPAEFLKEMENRYPDYDFMICECNYPAGNVEYQEGQQSNYLKKFFRDMNDSGCERLRAVIVYELMDEIYLQDDYSYWYGEAHYGIVHTTDKGTPGEVKKAYRTLQELLCGGIAEYRTVYTPAAGS